MREKLIEILRKPIFPHELVDPIEAVADYLLDSGVTIHEWIPVTERLPEEDGRYATVCNFGNVTTRGVLGFAKDFNKVTSYRTNDKNVWYEYDREYGFVKITYVTHWMPLPEPPKGDD